MRVFLVFILFLISLYKVRAQTEVTCTINRKRKNAQPGYGNCYYIGKGSDGNDYDRSGCLLNKEYKVVWDITIANADFPTIGNSIICTNVDAGFDQSDAFFAQDNLFKLNGGSKQDIVEQWAVSGFTGRNYPEYDVLESSDQPSSTDYLGGKDIPNRAKLSYTLDSNGEIRLRFDNLDITLGAEDFQFKFLISDITLSNDCDTVRSNYKWQVDSTNQYGIYYNDPDVDLTTRQSWVHLVNEVLYFYSGTTASGGAFDETATAKYLSGIPVTENDDGEGFYRTFKTEVRCGTEKITDKTTYDVHMCQNLGNIIDSALDLDVDRKGHHTWGWSVPENVCTDNVITTLIKYDELSFENQHQQKYSLHVHSVYPATSQTDNVNQYEIVDLVVQFVKNDQYVGPITEIPDQCREVFIEYAYQGSTLNRQLRDSDLVFTDANLNTIFDGDCSTVITGASNDPTSITHTYPIHIGILTDISQVTTPNANFYSYNLPLKVYGTVPKFESNRKLSCGETDKLLPLWECPDNSDGVTENTCGGYLVSTTNTNAYGGNAYLMGTLDQGTCTQNCFVLPDAYEFTSSCTTQSEFTLQECSDACGVGCEGFNMLESGGCEIVDSITDTGAFHLISSYNDNFHIQGLDNGADGLEPRVSFDAHHILNVGIDINTDSTSSLFQTELDLSQIDDAFIATSQEKGLYEPEAATWDDDCSKMQNGFCKNLPKLHECADLCNNDEDCVGYLQRGTQCQIVYDASGITIESSGTDIFWRQTDLAEFCDIHTSATEIYVKIELSDYDTQLYDSHNVLAGGYEMFLPINVNFLDASFDSQNQLYTGCPPNHAFKKFGADDIRCVPHTEANFPAANYNVATRGDTGTPARTKWWTGDSSSGIVNPISDGIAYGGCSYPEHDSSKNLMIMRFAEDGLSWTCRPLEYYDGTCWNTGSTVFHGETNAFDKNCGLNGECDGTKCVRKSGLSADEYLISNDGVHHYFTPLNDASYISAKTTYELNEATGIETYGPMSSWDLSRVTTRPFLTFSDIYLNNGLLGSLPSADSDSIKFTPQSFIRSAVSGKQFLEIRYFSKCVSESIENSGGTFISFCRIDGDTDLVGQDADTETSHSFLYGSNLINIPINYRLEPEVEGYRRFLTANTGAVVEHVCNSRKLSTAKIDDQITFTVTESNHLRSCHKNTNGIYPYACYEHIQDRICASSKTGIVKHGVLSKVGETCPAGSIISTTTGDNNYDGCLALCDAAASCTHFAYSNTECHLYSACASTSTAANHVLYNFVEEKFKLTESEYNDLEYRPDSLDEFIMSIYRGHKNFMEARCVGGSPDFYQSTSSQIVDVVLEDYSPNFKPWGAELKGDSLDVTSDSFIETILIGDVPLNAIERQSLTSGATDVEVQLEYCHNKCTENSLCKGVVVEEVSSSGDGLIDTTTGLKCHLFKSYDLASADWTENGCSTCVVYLKPENTVRYSDVLTNSDIVSPKRETDNLRHEFDEIPVVFDFEIERYPIAIRKVMYKPPIFYQQGHYLTAHQYKTIKNLGGQHPHFTMCLDTHSVDMKIYDEDTDFITTAICDVDKTGSFKEVNGETVETYSDRIFVKPELFTSRTGVAFGGDISRLNVIEFTFVAELHPEWRATNQDLPSGRRLRQLEELVLNPDEVYLISVTTTYVYDSLTGNFTNVEAGSSITLVESESAEFEKWILDHYDIGYIGGIIVFIVQIALISAGVFYFTIKKGLLANEFIKRDSEDIMTEILYVAFKIVVVTFLTQIVFTRKEWNNTFAEDSVAVGIVWSVVFPAVYCIVEAAYLHMINEGSYDKTTPVVQSLSDIVRSPRAWGGEVAGLAAYIGTFVILEAKSTLGTPLEKYDWLSRVYPGSENVWQYFVFPLTFALLLGMLRVISTVNGWFRKTWRDILMDIWSSLMGSDSVVIHNYELILTVIGHVLLFVILAYPIAEDNDTAAIVFTVLWAVYTLIVVAMARNSDNIVGKLWDMLPLSERV